MAGMTNAMFDTQVAYVSNQYLGRLFSIYSSNLLQRTANFETLGAVKVACAAMLVGYDDDQKGKTCMRWIGLCLYV